MAKRGMLVFFAFILAACAAEPPQESHFDNGVKAYNARDMMTAKKELRPLAEAGDAKSEYYLGLSFLYDESFPPSKEAIYWLEKAANQGLVQAQFVIGKTYNEVYCGPVFSPEICDSARHWLTLASQQGHTNAMTILIGILADGRYEKKDRKEAYFWALVRDSIRKPAPNSFVRKTTEHRGKGLTPEAKAEAEQAAQDWARQHPQHPPPQTPNK